MPKILVIDPTIINLGGDEGGVHHDVGQFAEVNKDTARMLAEAATQPGDGLEGRLKLVLYDSELEVLLCQIVRVLKDGAPYRMSKRAGTFVTLADLIDEVGRDVVRFIMLTRKSDAQMDFDIDAVQAQSKDNPVFYVQYAHARCCSVLRHAGIAAAESLAEVDPSALTDEAEMALVRALCAWPRVAESAALMREPHRVPYYLADVAALFHGLWAKGRDDAALRFIQADDPGGTQARLALVGATATVIASGLTTLGVVPVEEMR